MPKLTIPIGGGFYKDGSLVVINQECVNWAPSIPQVQGALSNAVLVDVPCITEISTTGQVNQKNRGRHTKSGKPYFLNGTTLIRIDKSTDTAGVVTFTNVALGTIPGTKNVSMADNGKQLMVLVPGAKGYIIDETNGTPFQEITDVDFLANGNPQYVVYNDGSFIVTTDTKKFIKSAVNDGLSWLATDRGTAEADPDNIVAPIIHANRVYICGSETIEPFVNQPNTNDLAAFPYIRTGIVIPKGVFAPLSLINEGNSFMFIGGGENEKAAVWSVSGNRESKLSTTAIDVVLGDLTDDEVAGITSYKYGVDGAFYTCFILPKTTFCYNSITGLWHEEKTRTLDSKGNSVDVSRRISGAITAYGLTLCGDQIDGRIGSIEASVYKDYGNLIQRKFSTAPISDKGNKISISMIELTVESGVGDFVTVDPFIGMSKSTDAKEFNDETYRSMGQVGEYDKRLIWTKQGSAKRFFNLEFTKSAPVKSTIIKLEVILRSHTRGS